MLNFKNVINNYMIFKKIITDDKAVKNIQIIVKS